MDEGYSSQTTAAASKRLPVLGQNRLALSLHGGITRMAGVSVSTYSIRQKGTDLTPLLSSGGAGILTSKACAVYAVATAVGGAPEVTSRDFLVCSKEEPPSDPSVTKLILVPVKPSEWTRSFASLAAVK